MTRYRRMIKFGVMLLVVCAAADVAMAQIPGPFAFSFFTSGLNRLFLLPFLIGGCQ